MSTEAITPDVAQVAHLQDMVELLEESLVDAQLALEDRGWFKPGEDGTVLTREQLREKAALARVMAVADPLIRRATNLRVAYVWGQGVTIAARQDKDAKQDVNAVIQAFLDDPSNRPTFTSGQAREELERRLATDGQAFHALVTSPLSGRVQVRVVPARQVDDIVTDPDDATRPWFYKRTHTRTVVEPGYSGATRTRKETRTVYHPAVGYWPKQRPRTIDGKDVLWDQPVIHTTVNRPEESLWGVGDLFAALPWARAYKEFLEDWARLVKALSRFAYQATVKNKKGGAQVRERITSPPADGNGQAGQTAIVGEGQKLEAIGKSGATIDSESGRPLAAMVAAGTDLPVTMLLADPGVTGARATAETLDEPLRLVIEMRRDLHADLIRQVLSYVVDQAIKAPQGPLKGTWKVDQATGLEQVELAGGQERTIDVAWPDLTQTPVDVLVKAITAADGTDTLPPKLVAQLLMHALDVDDVDEWLEQVTDSDGNFIYPADAAAARAQQDAVRAGDNPKD